MLGGGFHYGECLAFLHRFVVGLVLLRAGGHGVLERRDAKLRIERFDAFGDEFVRLKIDRVDGLAVDAAPKLLELFSLEVRVARVERVFTVVVDAGQLRGAENGVDELENLFFVGLQLRRERGKRAVLFGGVVGLGDVVGLRVGVVVLGEVAHEELGQSGRNGDFAGGRGEDLVGEVVHIGLARAGGDGGENVLLQAGDEVLVALVGNYGEHVDL